MRVKVVSREATMSGRMHGRRAEPQLLRAVETFEHFYLREYPQMVAVVYALTGQRWAAEELAQDALMRAYRAWGTVAHYDKPGAWLRRVTINLATSHLRRRITEAKALALMALSQRTPLEPHAAPDAALWERVRGLPRRQREAFVLHYVDGLPIAEIAEIQGIATTTVKTHLQRSREAVAPGPSREKRRT
jgi:RNA polymerase sigma-70 factor (ECF subfamily)